MPTFRIQRPRGISESVRSLMTSSPELSAADRIGVERASADIDRSQSLAEKARFEVEQERAADRRRQDPNERTRYGATVSGMTIPNADQLRMFIEGSPVVRPEGVTPEQERMFRSASGSVLANTLATGRTNAQQMTGAGENLLADAIRSQISAPETGRIEGNRLAHAIGQRTREPFKLSPQGVVLNEESGTIDETGGLAQAVRQATAALGTQRTAAGDASTARAETTRAPVARPPLPARPRTAAQEERDAAYAESRRMANERQKQGDKESNARRGFNSDPKMKGMKLGRWVKDSGFEVRDASGKLVGYYE